MKVEYRVKPITRYVVTRYTEFAEPDMGTGGSCETRGEYDNETVAYEVAYALCKAEHDKAGTPPGDPNFQYPSTPVVTKRAGTVGVRLEPRNPQ